VRIALALKQIDYEYIAVDLLNDAHKAQDYRMLNPMAQVPLLEWEIDGGMQQLGQSLAIINYLESRWPNPPTLPSDPLSKALSWQIAEIINAGIQPLQNSGVLRRLQRANVDETQWAHDWIEEGLGAVEALVAQSAGRYCIADRPTVADICLIPQLYNARRYDVDLSAFQHLLRVEAACEKLSAFFVAHPDRQPDKPKT